ncbi:MAG: YjjG family noncanonical pyrimidine nucleotidase [Chitinophagales bacterium]|nr:YjjG family noncanonical pyrimidine nucleotidase [Chitinophagales bacterium]MDW8428052.1 YjjG family noncanonical pyrimidine nucleotidase [Chitinophagales bacterium]
MPSCYRHIFFDWDETLWDFEANSRKVLWHLVQQYKLASHDEQASRLVECYHHHNQRYWELYRRGRIDAHTLRIGRWQQTLRDFGLDESLTAELAEQYLELLPEQTQLIAHAREVIRQLCRHFTLHVLTNGFQQVQERKLLRCGLSGYFQHLITAERAGSRKPDPAIFQYAFQLTGASADNSLMVGDSVEADWMGAQAVGMDCILLVRDAAVSVPPQVPIINSLQDLIDRLC